MRFKDFVARVHRVSGDVGKSYAPFIKEAKSLFTIALSDDLNISRALASLFDMMRQFNSYLDKKEVGTKGKEEMLAFFAKIDSVLGLLPLKEEVNIPAVVKEALEKRESAREAKDWKEADKQRDLILNAGFFIEDGPDGPQLKNR